MGRGRFEPAVGLDASVLVEADGSGAFRGAERSDGRPGAP
jgi:hypothetical protein